jgi:hypothetical protein
MAYNWAQLAFVEKWRLKAVRGQIVGMSRPGDKTFFDLRIRPGEGGAGALPGLIDLHLQDAGDIIREKRVGLLDRTTVVVRVVATPAVPVAGGSAPVVAARGKRWLEAGSTIRGTLSALEEDVGLFDAGFPVIVQFEEGAELARLHEGNSTEITISETPKGFLVV